VSVIDAEQLTVRFRRRWRGKPFMALDGLDLQVREGDFFGLLGENGAGKSTALHCFLGLLRPSAGRVRVFGRVPEPGDVLFRDVGYLPEEPLYHPYLTVQEATIYYASLSGVASPRTRVLEILDRLGLAEFRDRRLAKCSKGMRQKVGIAQCVLHRPRLLLLDEPMRGLDPMTVHLFRSMLLDLHRQGSTILMSSHLLSEVEQVATRVAILHRGRAVVQDDLAKLVTRSAQIYEVEIDEATEVPPQLGDVTQPAAGTIRGTLPAARFHDLMALAREGQFRVVRCALKQTTLEESFLSILTAKTALPATTPPATMLPATAPPATAPPEAAQPAETPHA
jgi:ABC-type multidrug transport system ATPase subunit